MWPFSMLSTRKRKTKAVRVIQQALENQERLGCFQDDPYNVANALIGLIQELAPYVFLKGKLGAPAGPKAIAANALGNVIVQIDDDHQHWAPFIGAFAEILRLLGRDQARNGLNPSDSALIAQAIDVVGSRAIPGLSKDEMTSLMHVAEAR